MEELVERVDAVVPLFLAFGDLVKLSFDRGCEIVAHDLREVLCEEVIHYDADVGGYELALVVAIGLLAGFAADLAGGHVKVQTSDVALLGRTVALGHIFACLDGRDGGSVGRRTPDAQFLHFLDKRSFGVALWMQGVTLYGIGSIKVERLAVSKGWQAVVAFIIAVAFFVVAFDIYLEETVKLDDFTAGDELQLFLARDVDFDLCLLNECIGHLAGDSS